MNEFADQGRQPPDDPWELVPASPDPPPRTPDPPVRVRIVWDAGISAPVARGLGQDDRGLLGAVVSPDPVAWKVGDVTKPAGDGFMLAGPARSRIAVRKSEDGILVLLGQMPRPADWAGAVPAAPARPAMPERVRIVGDARILPLMISELGQAERALFRLLARLGPGPRTVRDVQYVDFTLAAGDGFVVDSPALPQIAVGKTADAINVLLVPADPDPFSFRPHGDMGPFSRPRPGSDFGPIG